MRPRGVREEFAEALSRAMRRPASRDEAIILARASGDELPLLLAASLAVKRRHSGDVVTYSRKVFVPLTNLCRNECAYCGFSKRPGEPGAGYMPLKRAMELVRLGEKHGAKEVLVSTGEKPEERYPEALRELKRMGFASTLEYVLHFEEMVIKETETLMPHTNVGVLTKREMAQLKPLNASMGLMLECLSERLMEKGMPHERSPSKHPRVRLRVIREAGELRIPFTTGILIGIGETWEERVDSLIAIREIHRAYGHIQEVIIQNFMPEPGTPMESHPPVALSDLLKTIAVARLIMHGEVSVQAPPNLGPGAYRSYLLAGINDWGGVSPVTPDFINPKYPWPSIRELKEVTEELGFILRERLPIYPPFIKRKWYSELLRGRIESVVDESGLVKSQLEKF